MIIIAQFRSLKDLEKYVEEKLQATLSNKNVSKVFKETMSKAVDDVVYEAYSPKEYERRMSNKGLSDESNMVFTERTKNGNTLISLFENLTVGNEDVENPFGGYETDSMSGYFISHLIENGSDTKHKQSSRYSDGWYNPNGEWNEPRQFAKRTAEIINSPKSSANEKLKKILEKGINS